MACGSEASDNDDATRVVKEIRSATSIRGVKKCCILLLKFFFGSSTPLLLLLLLLMPSMMINASVYLALSCRDGMISCVLRVWQIEEALARVALAFSCLCLLCLCRRRCQMYGRKVGLPCAMSLLVYILRRINRGIEI